MIPRFRAHRNEQVLHCARLPSRLKLDNTEHQTMRCHEEYPQLKMRIVSLINDAQFIERLSRHIGTVLTTHTRTSGA